MDHAAYIKRKFFSNLDGIRALSVFAVIWHHTASDIFRDTYLLSQGYHGVSLFFVISGFLITTLLLREKSYQSINLKKFYIRRSLRIFPLYYAVIMLYIFAVIIFEKDTVYGNAFFNNLKYFITYTSNIFVPLIAGERVIFYFAWSLAVEEQFYAVWPWIEKYLSSNTILSIVITLIIFLIGINEGVYLQSALGNLITKVLVIPICMGVLLAHILHEESYYKYISKLFTFRYSSLLYFLGIVISLANHKIPNFTCYLFMTLFIGAVVVNPKSVMSNILENKAVAYIGTISYGVYLLHMLCFNVIKKISYILNIEHWTIFFLGTTILTVIVASFSYFTYESYFLKLKSKFG